MREGTERIVEECLSDNEAENTGGQLRVAMNPNLWYDVVIKTWITPVELKQECQQIVSLQNEVQPVALGAKAQRRFQYTFYNV